MRLTELQPRWIHPNVFTFKCPCCQKMDLNCMTAPMPMGEQFKLFEEVFGPYWNETVVPMNEKCAWNVSSTDFNTMSVTPSIDASACGHWHGHITNGEIR